MLGTWVSGIGIAGTFDLIEVSEKLLQFKNKTKNNMENSPKTVWIQFSYNIQNNTPNIIHNRIKRKTKESVDCS